ncbi:MAG: hydroxymethylglutaryl-CoA synthase [Myxococcaceae bacterium]|nr:hydroxymethylglutaryl-CoA synthase [Myxococcaceae bacterium]
MLNAGIEALGVAVPDTYLDMTELARARDVDPAKFSDGLGVQQMAVAAPHEDTVTLAASAARMALDGVDANEIGLCIVGTETAVDHSKPVASFLQGLLGLPSHCRVFETKHACYGGTAGLMIALDWLRSGSSRGRKALVVCSDIARYGVRTAGEPTQGAGAVALLVSDDPKLVALSPNVGTCSRDVMDFWRPLYRKDAIVDGQYSLTCYLEAVQQAYLAWQVQGGGVKPYASDRFSAICYHVPFPKMAFKAHGALRTFDGDATPSKSFEWQVKSGLELPRRVGNVYTGSLYLSLASVLACDARDLSGSELALFSYGSGSCAEFFTGRVTSGAQARVRALALPKLLDARRRISVAEYERTLAVAVDERPVAQEPSRAFGFLGVEQDRRVYARS